MQIHASCAARGGAGVLVVGPPSSGKSDLVFRLLDQGFTLVADDQVVIEDGIAHAPDALKGLIEIRGLGIVRMDYLPSTPLRLLVRLAPGAVAQRLPEPARDTALALPVFSIDPWHVSAARRIALALDCVLDTRIQLVGAFAP